MQRRSLLALGAASAAVIALAGGGAALLRPGVTDARLSAGGRALFASIGAALLEGSLPREAPARAAALGGLLDRVEALIAGLPPHAQAELSQLVALLDTAAGRRAIAGLANRWPDASIADVQDALQGMRISSLSLRRQAYQALHDITCGAYFSSADTWALLGYPGPMAV